MGEVSVASVRLVLGKVDFALRPAGLAVEHDHALSRPAELTQCQPFRGRLRAKDMLRQAQGRWIGPVDRLGVEPARSPGSGGNSRQ